LLAPSAAIADGPTNSLAKDEVLRGHFAQDRQITGFKKALRTEGRFVLAPSRGLIWQAEKPFAVTTIITPAGLDQTVDGKQMLNLEAAKLPFLSRLYAMLGGALAGDWSKMESDFIVTRAGDDRRWQVRMVPRKADDPAMPFRSIVVNGGRFLNKILLTKADGDQDTLTFTDQVVTKIPLAPAEAAAFDNAAQ
jgi:Outer membrane lipoprotein carrier protein LolA-like